MVYIVTEGCYSDYQIKCVFSTRELAEAYIKASTYTHSGFNDVEEYQLDTEKPPEIHAVYCCNIDLNTGDIGREWTETLECSSSHSRVHWHYPKDKHISVESAVSVEHSRKVAAEARQAHLRDEATKLQDKLNDLAPRL